MARPKVNAFPHHVVIDLTSDDDAEPSHLETSTRPINSKPLTIVEISDDEDDQSKDVEREKLVTPPAPPKKRRSDLSVTPKHAQPTAARTQQLRESQSSSAAQRSHKLPSHEAPARIHPLQVQNVFKAIQSCDACKITGQACDGEQPCNTCLVGLDCTYFEADKDQLPQYILVDQVERLVEVSAERHLIAERDIMKYERAAKAEKNEDSKATVPRTLDCGIAAQHEKIDESKIPGQEPKSFKDVLEVVTKTKRNLDNNREYWLQGELLRFVASARETDIGSSCKSCINPWKKHLATFTTNSATYKVDGHLTVQVKTQTSAWKPTRNAFQYLDSDRKLPMLPKYRSYGTLGPSVLARNVHTLQAIPYFPDEEQLSDDEIEEQRREDLATAYRNWDGQTGKVSSDFEKQRKCLERVHRWHKAFWQLASTIRLNGDEIKQYFQSSPEKCKVCQLKSGVHQSLGQVSKLDDGQITKLKWLSIAMSQAGISIWHFVEDKISNSLALSANITSSDRNDQSSLCAICFLQNCFVHGSYTDDFANEFKERVLINDAEDQHNRRLMVIKRPYGNADKHICNIYCCHKLHSGTKLQDLLGIDDTQQWTGLANESLELPTTTSASDVIEPCSGACYKFKANREGKVATVAINEAILMVLNEREVKLLRRTIDLYKSRLDLPCLLASRLEKTCKLAFRLMLAMSRTCPPVPVAVEPRERAKNYDTRFANFLDQRPPFIPCSHDGPCQPNTNCSCAGSKIHCERFCGCSDECGRRFKGCTCAGSCFRDNRCACWALNRECDPWLCSCGVLEVLDPSNKYNVEVRQAKKCCKNNRLQLGIPARTVKAESDVQGWGLFAGVDMPKWTFIGEYKGEIVSDDEGKRRGIVYHNVGQEYLFDFNTQQSLDGSMFANKTRFMNNSTNNKYINIVAHKLIANGVTRVMFYTKRSVKAGEELLYNYNYPKEVQARFWEKGARSDGNALIPIPKPRLAGIGSRTARRTSDTQDSRPALMADGENRPGNVPKSRKRKRSVEEKQEPKVSLSDGDAESLARSDSASEPSDTDDNSVGDVGQEDQSSSYDEFSDNAGDGDEEDLEEEEVSDYSQSDEESHQASRQLIPTRGQVDQGREATASRSGLVVKDTRLLKESTAQRRKRP